MEQEMNCNKNSNWSSWWIIILLVLSFIVGFVAGSNQLRAQSPAILKGYYGDSYMTTTAYVDYQLSEDNRKLNFVFGGDTIHFNVWKENNIFSQDSIIRTEYILNKNSRFVVEPNYRRGQYVGDYCKMIMRNSDLFDKIVLLFWSDPSWTEI